MSSRSAIPSYPLAPLGPNWLGLFTLYVKEVRRFFNVFTQTVLAPVVSTLLFLAVFSLGLGRGRPPVDGLALEAFLAPGLIIMAMVQNAFANTSSSLVIGKVQGNIVDVLMPPLSPLELTVAYAGAGVTRGLVVGLATGLAMLPFVSLAPAHPAFVLAHGLGGAAMLALIGILGGLWSEKFDHIAAVTNFVVTPAAFLSGTFYSIQRLPEPWATVAHWNPFFYMIDGFRYGFTGHADGATTLGLGVVAGVDLALAALAYRLFKTGYKLKA